MREKGIPKDEAARRFIAGSLWPFMKGREGEDRYYARQFFPVVTRDDSFREIDQYLQHCARFILTGKWGKAQYRAPVSQAIFRQSIHLHDFRELQIASHGIVNAPE